MKSGNSCWFAYSLFGEGDGAAGAAVCAAAPVDLEEPEGECETAARGGEDGAGFESDAGAAWGSVSESWTGSAGAGEAGCDFRAAASAGAVIGTMGKVRVCAVAGSSRSLR